MPCPYAPYTSDLDILKEEKYITRIHTGVLVGSKAKNNDKFVHLLTLALKDAIYRFCEINTNILKYLP